jgi:hypothetical protein
MATGAVEVVVVIVITVWAALSALAQVPINAIDRLRSLDFFGHLPSWTFFAPNPPTGDYVLMYRHRTREGYWTYWKEYRLPPRRAHVMTLWNPWRRYRKALFDLVVWLAEESSTGGSRVRISIPYVMLLTAVAAVATERPMRAVQFSVLKASPSVPDPEVLMVSDVHEL